VRFGIYFFLPAFEAQATVEYLYGLYVLQSGKTKLIPALLIHETTGYDEWSVSKLTNSKL